MDFQETKTDTNGRLKLYKLQSPHWRQTYRKRCHERLKHSRARVLEGRRGLGGAGAGGEDERVHSVMAEEWQRLSQEEAGVAGRRGAGDVDSMEFEAADEGENIDEVLSLFEGIRAELLAEERAILAEYEEGVGYDEAALSASLSGLPGQQVVCPVCKKSSLKLNKGVLFCACGVRVDTEQDCVSLDYVQRSMDTGIQQHDSMCDSPVAFSSVHQPGITNLMMACNECDFMYIVV